MNRNPEDRDSLNIAEYIWLVRQGKWIILAFVVASMAVSIYMTARTKPVYQSSATFIYDFTSSMSQALDFQSIFWFEIDAQKNNQIQIIRSRSMAEMVADSIMRSPDSDSLLAILFSGAVPEPQFTRPALIGLVAGNIGVSVMKDSDFFILSATGSSPSASAVLANLVVQTFFRRNLEEVRGENREIRQFLESQLVAVEGELLGAEESLRTFKEENSLVDLGSETSELVTTLVTLETSASTARTDAGALQARRDYMLSRVESMRAGLSEEIAGLNNTYINSLQTDLALLETSRAGLLADGVPPDDAALQDIEDQIAGRREALGEALAAAAGISFPADLTGALQGMMIDIMTTEAEIRASRTRESALLSAARDVESRLSGLPAAEMTLARLERNRTVSENVYILMRTRFEEIRIAEAGQIGNVTIIDSALPGGLIRPSRQRNLMMGLLVGLALGMGAVFLRERLDTSISSPEQIESMGIAILGVIPKMRRSAGDYYSTASGISSSLVTHLAPRDPVSESYRDLRTSMRFSKAGAPPRSILVTSAGPREGKSTTSSNLAVAFAQSGQRCLLVDADLRRPVVHNLFSIEREPGLAEAVAGLVPLDDCIRKIPVENLDILPCGFIPHNPSELLGSARMKAVLEELYRRYEMIIIDSPPVAVVTDALIMAPEVDGTLMVIGAKLGNRRVVQTAFTKLGRSSASVLGAVLNGFDPLRMYTAYGYYTYRYYYYYSDGRKRGSKPRRTDKPVENQSD